MVEMVCLHVISLMEALQECNSTIFVKVGKTYDFIDHFLLLKTNVILFWICHMRKENKTDLILMFRVGAGGFRLM